MTRWEQTKEMVANMTPLLDTFIDEKMEQDPSSVKSKIIMGKGSFFEYEFNHNGFNCFVRLHKGKEKVGEIIAFNDKQNVCCYRRIDEMF